MKLFTEISVSIELEFIVFILLSKEKSYVKFKLSNNWLLIDPNISEFFLLIVELIGISFSPWSLITVANLSSKNLSSLSLD